MKKCWILFLAFSVVCISQNIFSMERSWENFPNAFYDSEDEEFKVFGNDWALCDELERAYEAKKALRSELKVKEEFNTHDDSTNQSPQPTSKPKTSESLEQVNSQQKSKSISTPIDDSNKVNTGLIYLPRHSGPHIKSSSTSGSSTSSSKSSTGTLTSIASITGASLIAFLTYIWGKKHNAPKRNSPTIKKPMRQSSN